MTGESRKAVRSARRPLQLEICAWQWAAALLLAVSIASNAALYGLLNQQEVRHAREVDELRRELRTAAKIVEEVKRMDPETDLTESCVRRLTKQGAFPVVWAGSKALINLDDVLELLRLGTVRSAADPVPTVGGIRRIDPKRTK